MTAQRTPRETTYPSQCGEDQEAIDARPDNLAVKLQALSAKTRAAFTKELETTNFPPMAEQYYRLALATLEQAESFARLADYNLSRGE